MKILLAGPGTGKTTKIKSLIKDEYSEAKRIKVLSFTNATINDLKNSLNEFTKVSCSTLHSFALSLNHLPELYILSNEEKEIIEYLSEKIEIDYNILCNLLKCISYDDMIVECNRFISSNPEYAKSKLGELDLLIIDEFQDFNAEERELVKQISSFSTETIILGDDDQSIYSFKDADPNGIIDLYNDSKVEKLKHDNICYRCPDIVIENSVKLINKNRIRINKEILKSNKDGKLLLEQFKTQNESDEYIIKTLNSIKTPVSVLILSPVRFAIKSLKEKLIKANIPFKDWWENTIDLDILIKVWWLNAIFSNNKILFIIFLLKNYKMFTKKPGLNMHFLKYFQSGLNEEDLIGSIIKLNALPKNLSALIIKKPKLDEFYSENPEYLIFEKYISSDNIEYSLKNILNHFRRKLEFEQGKINLMSIHKSKGLQSDYVFMNGLVSGIIPNAIRGVDTIEAQRRLLYVGMTRAKKELHLISTIEWDSADVYKVDKNQFKYNYKNKKWYGRTSIFIDEFLK